MLLLAAACAKEPLSLGDAGLYIDMYETHQLTLKRGEDVVQADAWESTNPSICTVDNGLLEAISVGTVTITATFDGDIASVNVEVLNVNYKPIITVDNDAFVENAMQVEMGKTETLIASATYRNRTDCVEITYQSANSNIATVNENGAIYGKKKGETNITVTARYKGAVSTSIVKVNVWCDYNVQTTSSIQLIKDGVVSNENKQIENTITMLENAYIGDYSAEYTSQDTSIATVSNTGLVTAVSVGITAIDVKVTVAGYEFYNTVSVKVVPKQIDVYVDDYEVYANFDGENCQSRSFRISNVINGTPYNFEPSPYQMIKNGVVLQEGMALKNGNNLIISGDDFGANVYGDVIVKIMTSDFELNVHVNVITKKLNSLKDLKNIGNYGGATFDNDWQYNGYFVLTTDIDLKGETYIKSFEHANVAIGTVNIYHKTYYGFMGVFDGQGHTIKNAHFDNYTNGGIFGNVGRTGVIKNLGVIATLAHNKRSAPFGHNVSGTIQNCYISVSSQENKNVYQGSAIGVNTTNLRLTDTIIKYDGSNNLTEPTNMSGFIADVVSFPLGVGSGKWNCVFPIVYTNTYAFVKDPAGAVVNASNGYHPTYLDPVKVFEEDIEMYVNINETCKLAYDATINFTPTANSNASYWDLSGSQPIFKTAK